MARKDKWKKRWGVESFSDPDTKYTVALDWQGNYGCSCPAWRFQRKKNPICKHIHYVISLDNVERAALLMQQYNIQPLNANEWKVFVVEDNSGEIRVGMSRAVRARE